MNIGELTTERNVFRQEVKFLNEAYIRVSKLKEKLVLQ